MNAAPDTLHRYAITVRMRINLSFNGERCAVSWPGIFADSPLSIAGDILPAAGDIRPEGETRPDWGAGGANCWPPVSLLIFERTTHSVFKWALSLFFEKWDAFFLKRALHPTERVDEMASSPVNAGLFTRAAGGGLAHAP